MKVTIGHIRTICGIDDPYLRPNAAVRARFGGDAAGAAAYFRRYVACVDSYAPARARILDAGCGVGWSTHLLRERGHDAVGMDIHTEPLEVDIPFVRGDLAALPFGDEEFDVVAMHQVVEHLADPDRALHECVRVLRRGGRLVVVGPNLASIPLALRSVTLNARRLRRKHDAPRHPFGNTLPEALGAAARSLVHTVRGLVARTPRFARREPDPRPPFHADNDATWFCNPMELRTWGRANGLHVLRWWAADRPGARVWWPLAAGSWVVLEKR